MGRVSACPWSGWQRLLIRLYVRVVGPDLHDSVPDDPRNYASLDALFTRPVRSGTRPWPRDPTLLGSPVDGIFLGQTSLDGPTTILDVKGRSTRAGTLLGPLWTSFPPTPGSGLFHFYLSPRHHHRVHLPCAARFLHQFHLKGRLLPVSPPWLRRIPDLNAKNERTLLVFETATGEFLTLVLVAAAGVSDIETAFEPYPGLARLQPRSRDELLDAGTEVGCFHLGSTVFVVTPPGLTRSLLDEPPVEVRAGVAFAAPRAVPPAGAPSGSIGQGREKAPRLGVIE